MTDFTVQDEGTIALLKPHSPAAERWANEHIGEGNGYQPYWPTLVVEPRYLGNILEGIDADGLTFS